ncbi:predicted protein [Postia placenta Mad-698-R]|nr:predicted protein [Postia placenta Mad-698-R]
MATHSEPGQASACYRALNIDELYTRIVSHVDSHNPRSLANLALTCRSYSEIPLRTLWYELRDLAPLLKLLPCHKWREVSDVHGTKRLDITASGLEDDCFTRMDYYSHFVKKLSLPFELMEVLASIKHRCLLPQVRNFQWQPRSSVFVECIAPLLGPSLETLMINSATVGLDLSAVLQTLPERAPRLTKLYIREIGRHETTATSVEELLLAQTASLTTFSFTGTLTSNSILALAKMPNLVAAVVGTSADQLSKVSFPVGSFPALETLDIKLDKLDRSISPLLNAIDSTSFTHFRLTVADPGSPGLLTSHMRALSRFHLVFLQVLLGRIDATGSSYLGSSEDVVSLGTLRPLLDIQSLQYLGVRAPRLEVDEHMLDAISQSLPHIKALSLENMSGELSPGLGVLLPLAQQCRELCHVRMDFNVSIVPPIPTGICSNNTICRLSVAQA